MRADAYVNNKDVDIEDNKIEPGKAINTPDLVDKGITVNRCPTERIRFDSKGLGG